MVDEELVLVAKANVLKDEGNLLLSQKKYVEAVAKYSEAITLYPNNVIYYSNRAQAFIKSESYGFAILDANEALKLDPKYIKAYYRRGSANYALGKFKLAFKDFKAVAAIVPKDVDAQKKMKLCEKAMKDEAFAKAIEADEPPYIPVDFESIIVDSSYKGPKFDFVTVGDEGSKDKYTAPVVTMEFVVEMMEHFKAQKLLHRKFVLAMLSEMIRRLQSTPTLLRLSLPPTTEDNASFTVCGDTHGQFYDLCNIFHLGGMPSDSSYYLFNGDFVDRGSFSFETAMTLIALWLAKPQSLHLLRGNHETKNMNSIYGFQGEVMHKYNATVMKQFAKLFNLLPLAAVIENKVFVVHGGLRTEEEVTLAHIEALTRDREPPQTGLMSDLLWADPQEEQGKAPSKRGIGFAFGPDHTEAFLRRNDLQLLVRSHEMQPEGYALMHGGRCITVFSAPNYCDEMGNKGAFIRFSDRGTMAPVFTCFDAVPHPAVPPMAYASNMFGI